MFRTRLVSGIVLILIAFAAFFLGAPVLTVLLMLISLVGYRELAQALDVSGSRDRAEFSKEGREEKKSAEKTHFGASEIVGYVGIVLYYLVVLLTDLGVVENGMFFLTACVSAVFLAELFVYVLAFPKYQAEQIAFAFFSFVYAPVMLSFIDLTRGLENGRFLVWFVLICSWGCDTCAYCVGKLIGKKKVFPVLSPKKSLEGCIGGVAGAALIAFLYGIFVADGIQESLLFALVGAVGAVVSMVGDLAASAIKRNKGIKDYGKLIPGHGGIMDRFDSVIVTAPIIYFLSALFL